MILKELNIASFGKFRDKILLLDDGLNLIYGENETGKTTIHKFIEGMFFGFFKPYSKRKMYTDDYERYFPWKYSEYNGMIKFDYKGETYRLERNFMKSFDEVKIFDDKTGEDITYLFDYDPVLRLHSPNSITLGFNSVVYNNTISIKQLGSKTDELLAREVKNSLINIGGSLDEDISVKNSIQKLNNEINLIGTAAQKKSSPYGKIVEELNILYREREEALNFLELIREQEINYKNFKEELIQLENEKDYLRKKFELIEKKELRERYEEATKTSKEIGCILVELRDLKSFSSLNFRDFTDLLTLGKGKENIEKNISEWNEELENVRKCLIETQNDLRGLNKYESIDNGTFDITVEKYKILCNKKNQLNEIDKKVDTLSQNDDIINEYNTKDLVEDIYLYETIEDEKNKLFYEKEFTNVLFLKSRKDEKSKELKRKNIFIMLSSFLILVFIFAGLKRSLYFLFTLPFIAFCIYNIYSHKEIKKYVTNLDSQVAEIEKREKDKDEMLKKLELEMSSILEKYNCLSKAELKKLLNTNYENSLTYKNNSVSYDMLKDEKKDLEVEIEKIQSDLLNYSNIFGDMLDLNFEEIKAIEKEHLEYIKLEENENKLLGEQKYLEDKINNLNNDLKDTLNKIEKILIVNNVKDAEEFEKGLKKKEEYDDLIKDLENKKLLLNKILGNSNLEYLKSKAMEIEDDLTIDEKFAEKDDVILRLKELDENITKTRLNLTRVEEKINNLLANFRPLVEIDEDIEIKENKKTEYENKLKSLQIAKDTIESISKNIQREFAPTLNKKVSEVIYMVTDGRYNEVKIDENINISVVEPDSNTLIDIGKLSGGTIDQIYFSTRIGISDLILKERVPLILDDCFVQYDINRLENILRLLVKKLGDRQILMFTCHTREREILDKLGVQYNYINL